MKGAASKEPRAEAFTPGLAGPVTGYGEVARHLDKNIRRSRVPRKSIQGEGIAGVRAIGNIVADSQNRITNRGISQNSDCARAVPGLVRRNPGGGRTVLADESVGRRRKVGPIQSPVQRRANRGQGV